MIDGDSHAVLIDAVGERTRRIVEILRDSATTSCSTRLSSPDGAA